MGWEMNDAPYVGKPVIYNWYYNEDPPYYQKADPPYYSWAGGGLWQRLEASIKFINDTDSSLKLKNVAIKTVSCHSGGKYYWSSTGLTIPCYGYGAKYTCYVRVSNDDEKTYQESSKFSNTVPNINSSNMNSPGTSTTNTAKFGDPPFTGDKGLILRSYVFDTCPVIEPGGIARLHLHVDLLDPSKKYSTNIRFLLNPDEMEIQFEPELGPYIWRFCEDGAWHLRRPMQIQTGNGWSSVEEIK